MRPALSAALAYNVVPYLMLIPYRSDGRSADSAFWSQAVDYVRTHGAGGYRVEVVPTASHWEAYWVPKADIALARGWYRQLDEADNSVLYGEQLSGQEYRAWLRSVGVRYVVRPLTKLDFAGATGEAALLDSGRSGLAPVLRTSQVVVYELPAATPILTGSNPSRITTFSHDRIAGASSAAGSYFLRVRYTPYWDVIAGDVCLSRGPNGMTTMSVRTPGPFVLSAPSSPEDLVESLAIADEPPC